MNSRLIGKYKVEVKLVKFEKAKEVANGLLVKLLPAHFEATGLPYSVNYVVNEKEQITKLTLTLIDQTFDLSKAKLPLGRLRSMALMEATRSWNGLEEDLSKEIYVYIHESLKEGIQ